MSKPANDPPLNLPSVTLCAVSSVNVKATINALEQSMKNIDFAECLFFSDRKFDNENEKIKNMHIENLSSSISYSNFILNDLVENITTSHCLISQWDGHVLDFRLWLPEFLEYDYIGAGWPQFSDGHDVGNGGFSLRSRRLMKACQAPDFVQHHPEDLAVCRTNRNWLESQGMRFAPRELADRFSAERGGDLQNSFGYHGAFNMPQALGAERFWQIYRELDEKSTIRHDFYHIVKAVGRHQPRRALRMLFDRLSNN